MLRAWVSPSGSWSCMLPLVDSLRLESCLFALMLVPTTRCEDACLSQTLDETYEHTSCVWWQDLLANPTYLGLRRKRATGQEYEAVIDEFMDAIYHRYPNVLVQFEDFQANLCVCCRHIASCSQVIGGLLSIYSGQTPFLICPFNADCARQPVA
eukprot:SAG31_NODE_1196_length_9445_cov_9.153970_8_plen_154_part_00